MISSASGFCASVSCSMVNCGKRGSLLITCDPTNVSATEPTAAASATDTNDTACLMGSPDNKRGRRAPLRAQQCASTTSLARKSSLGTRRTPRPPGDQPPEHRMIGAFAQCKWQLERARYFLI